MRATAEDVLAFLAIEAASFSLAFVFRGEDFDYGDDGIAANFAHL